MIKENKMDVGEQKSVYKGYLGIQGVHNYDVDQAGAFLVEVDVKGSGKDFVYD